MHSPLTLMARRGSKAYSFRPANQINTCTRCRVIPCNNRGGRDDEEDDSDPSELKDSDRDRGIHLA